ncbi:MAG: hypothetical protein H6645_01465 [Caldilineaceae bacterium]|nr:hypothetical protein [Caldilineaceae bacterium]MCB9155770.1 hypothetical protein [Caldilineaceae bacterium]
MKTDQISQRSVFGFRMLLAFTVVMLMISLFGANTTTAYAKKPKPTPTPTPTVPTVPPPGVITVLRAEDYRFVVDIDPNSGYSVVGEYVSGPIGAQTPQVHHADHDGYWIDPLLPDSDYVFRFKRSYYFDSSTNTLYTVTSDYTTYSFHTPTIEESRPSAPVISVAEITNDYVGFTWQPSTDNASPASKLQYVYTINGGSNHPTCVTYCTGGIPGLVLYDKSLAGSKLVVYAIDQAGNLSLPSNELVIPTW